MSSSNSSSSSSQRISHQSLHTSDGQSSQLVTEAGGLRGRKASQVRMDSPLIESLNTPLLRYLLVTLTTLLSSSIEGLMGLREEHQSSLSFKGLELSDESSLSSSGELSDYPDCSPNERCSPESMVGTMNPLGGNPRPFQGGEESEGLRDHIGWEKYIFFPTNNILC